MLVKKNWPLFWKWFWGSLFFLISFVIAAIWFVDPYGNLPLSPPLKRTPMATNQRYSYPSIARNGDFDSAVFGTSTSRLLRPQALNDALGGHFVNLSMNSAMAYEQARLFEVFVDAHEAPKTVIVGLDASWCTIESNLAKYTFRRFPEWMYDTNPWNDVVHMLEFKTFEILGKQAGFLLGVKKAKYGYDGYADFLPPDSEYDLEKVQKGLYNGSISKQKTPLVASVLVTDAQRASWTYPSHELMPGMFSALPEGVRIILYFVPYHLSHQPEPGSIGGQQWQECKNRIVKIAGQINNTVTLDFMINSPITQRDENYWDYMHYTRQTSESLVRLIAIGSRGVPAPNGEYVILTDTTN